MTDQAFGGGRDRFCPPEVFRESANGIPNTRLVHYEDCAHGNTFADRRIGRDVVAFLKAENARALERVWATLWRIR
jgi:hypothetical protein